MKNFKNLLAAAKAVVNTVTPATRQFVHSMIVESEKKMMATLEDVVAPAVEKAVKASAEAILEQVNARLKKQDEEIAGIKFYAETVDLKVDNVQRDVEKHDARIKHLQEEMQLLKKLMKDKLYYEPVIDDETPEEPVFIDEEPSAPSQAGTQAPAGTRRRLPRRNRKDV